LLQVAPAASLAAERDEEYHRDYIYGVPSDPSDAWTLASGARLYDNWMSSLDVDAPEGTHPAWPASNTKKEGKVTWRCKSCHGWDYAGKDGAYAKGSYKTGIKGVRAYAGADPAEIHKILMDDTHGFTHEMIPVDAMLRIATFVSKGQVDVASYITADKVVSGDAGQGKAVFQNICAACHGHDGKALNWGSDEEPGYIGTEAQANPWEVLHKARAGHPGVEMPALMPFPIQDALNVLKYTQTLPAK
jgi:thiosulfate dehydrogenase